MDILQLNMDMDKYIQEKNQAWKKLYDMVVTTNTSCPITYAINHQVGIRLHDDKKLVIMWHVTNGSNTRYTYIIHNNRNCDQSFGDITYVKNYIKNSIDSSRGG
jgi:hypothetical protein